MKLMILFNDTMCIYARAYVLARAQTFFRINIVDFILLATSCDNKKSSNNNNGNRKESFTEEGKKTTTKNKRGPNKASHA